MKQFGSLWVERVHTLEPESGLVQHYDFIWRQHRTVRGKLEFRLARIIDRTAEEAKS
jgi:hypothetical protein